VNKKKKKKGEENLRGGKEVWGQGKRQERGENPHEQQKKREKKVYTVRVRVYGGTQKEEQSPERWSKKGEYK